MITAQDVNLKKLEEILDIQKFIANKLNEIEKDIDELPCLKKTIDNSIICNHCRSKEIIKKRFVK